MSLLASATGHAPLRGALWMIGAGACFALGNSLLRYLTGVLPSYAVAFLQYGLALLILLPWVLVRGLASVRTARPWFQALRVAAAAIGVVFITLGFQKLPVVEVVAPTPLSLVCFRARGAGLEPERQDELNQRLMDRLNESGEAFISHTRLGERLVLRLAIGNIRTQLRHVRRAYEILRDGERELRKSSD